MTCSRPDDEQHRADGRQHDVAEARDRPGAVDLGGLDQLLGQLGERGVDRERDERHAHPHHDHGRDEEERQRPQEPPVALEVEAEPGEDVVHDAVLGVEEPLPHRERGDDRHRPREQQPGLHEESYAARHVPHQQREADADRHRERRVDEAEGDGAEGDPPQVAVGDERAVVVGADPLRRSAELLGEAEVLQGQHDLAHERVAQRQRQGQHGGDQERVRQQGGRGCDGGPCRSRAREVSRVVSLSVLLIGPPLRCRCDCRAGAPRWGQRLAPPPPVRSSSRSAVELAVHLLVGLRCELLHVAALGDGAEEVLQDP